MEDNEIVVDTVAELDETVGRVDVVEGLCDESTQACDQLSDIAETITETGKEPSETTVKVAEIAVEAICARLGIKAATKVSFESYAISAESVVEKIKEVGKKIWDSLVKAFKWVLEKIEHIYNVITKNRDYLLKHLKEQQAQAEALTEEGDLSEKTLKGSMNADFSISGKTNTETVKTIINNEAKLFLVAKKGNEVVAQHLKKFKDHRETFLDVKFGKEEEEAMNSGLLEDIEKMLNFLGFSHQQGKNSEGHIDRLYGQLLGGTQVRLYASPLMGVKIAIVKTSKNQSETAEVLTKSQILEILSASIKLLDVLKDFEGTIDDLKKHAKECSNYCIMRYTKPNFLGKSASNPTSDKAIAAALFTLNSLISKLTMDMPVSVFKTAAASGRYVGASMRMHKQPAKAENTYSTPLLA